MVGHCQIQLSQSLLQCPSLPQPCRTRHVCRQAEENTRSINQTVNGLNTYPWGFDGGDEELRTVGVFTSIGHGKKARFSVLEVKVLIFRWICQLWSPINVDVGQYDLPANMR